MGLDRVRKAARGVSKVMNFCVNPACLHSEKTKGCACCARGCVGKKKTKTRRR